MVGIAEKLEKRLALSRTSIAGLSDLLDQGVLSLETSDPADSMLLAPFSQEEGNVVEEGEESVCTESSHPVSPTYGELLGVMAWPVRLDLA